MQDYLEKYLSNFIQALEKAKDASAKKSKEIEPEKEEEVISQDSEDIEKPEWVKEARTVVLWVEYVIVLLKEFSDSQSAYFRVKCNAFVFIWNVLVRNLILFQYWKSCLGALEAAIGTCFYLTGYMFQNASK